MENGIMLTLKKKLLVALPFVKRENSISFQLFDTHSPHSLGSVSRFFILKLAEGFALEDIVSVIPFDTFSITKRLQQLGFIQNGELTEIGRDWACALSLHGRPYEAWVLWGYRFQIVLPADTPFLQTKSSLSGVLIYYPKKDRGMAPMNYKEKYRTLDLFRFISSEDVSFAFHDSLTREWEIKSVPCQNADGDNNVKYLVVEIPEGEELHEKGGIGIAMPVLRRDVAFASPRMAPSMQGNIFSNFAPPPPCTCFFSLLDGSRMDGVGALEVPRQGFCCWPEEEWMERLSDLVVPEEGDDLFSRDVSLSLLWQHGVVSMETLRAGLKKTLGENFFFSEKEWA